MSDTLVDAQWLSARLDDPKVKVIEISWVDTEAYETGHIPGAQLWSWKDWLWDGKIRDFPSPEEFAGRCASAGISNDTTVVFYGPAQFATYAWWVFNYLHHADARVLDGGRTVWQNAGLPLTAEVPTPVPATYTPPAGRNDSMRARRDEILANLDAFGRGDQTVLLDLRSAEEYEGSRVNIPGSPDHGAERGGHIPNARHMPFTEFLNEDTSYKAPADLAALLEARGATADKAIVAYCRLSHRATLSYFVMTQLLGYKNVRSYDGSWTEWGSMVGMPVE